MDIFRMCAAKCYTGKKTRFISYPKIMLWSALKHLDASVLGWSCRFSKLKLLSPKPSSDYPGLGKAVVRGSRTSERGVSCRGVKLSKIPK